MLSWSAQVRVICAVTSPDGIFYLSDESVSECWAKKKTCDLLGPDLDQPLIAYSWVVIIVWFL